MVVSGLRVGKHALRASAPACRMQPHRVCAPQRHSLPLLRDALNM
jgi:hypothetical protein